MSASEVQICNLALLKFGAKSITALTDDTKEARACALLYPLMRDEMTYSHPWRFALKRANISGQIATAPAFEYDFAYSLPADCLRVWELHGSDETWEVENGQFLTNQDSDITIRYIANVTTTGFYSPGFVACLALRLAAELSDHLSTDGGGKRVGFLEELQKIALPAALSLNALESNAKPHKNMQPLDAGNYSWQKEGH